MNKQTTFDPRLTELDREFLASYDPKRYTPVAVTVDVAALTVRDGQLAVLLVQRATPPFANYWCLPGGFIKPDGAGVFPELVAAAAARMAIETGLDIEGTELARVHLEQLGAYGAPGRDPRLHVVNVAHLAFAPNLPDPVPGPGAAAVRWVPVSEALELSLAFDHNKILRDAIERARSKLEYTPLATAFLAETFTIDELRRVYEIVWGEELIKSGFRRKVHATHGFVEAVSGTTGSGRGRRAQLYRAGSRRKELYPPIRRVSKAFVV